MAIATLGAIRDKVRKITRSPSQAQLTDAVLDEYVNTFIAYDFPYNLRLFSLRQILTFYTQPNVGVYKTTTAPFTDPLYNFNNRVLTVHQPIYMAGVPAFYTQDRSIFYNTWPKISSVADTQLRGTGAPSVYTGNLNTVTGVPVMQYDVMFTANDIGGTAMILTDNPVSNTTGALGIPNHAQTLPSPYGQINYLTGAFTLVFPNSVALGATITSETIPYQPAKPIGMLFYNERIALRPIPDKAYPVQLEVDVRPTELIQTSSVPQLEQWWQYIAMGACIKIFQDRMDLDSVEMVMPEFIRQQDMVSNTTACQYASEERARTVYNSGNKIGAGWFLSSWPY